MYNHVGFLVVVTFSCLRQTNCLEPWATSRSNHGRQETGVEQHKFEKQRAEVLSMEAKKQYGALVLHNILPQRLYLDLDDSFSKAFGKNREPAHSCVNNMRCGKGKQYRSLKLVRANLNLRAASMCANVLNAPRQVDRAVFPVFQKTKEYIFSPQFERYVFQNLNLPVPGPQVVRNIRILLEHFGRTSFHAGIPHTDRDAWQATLQLYLPEGHRYAARYGTCFHDSLSNGEAVLPCGFRTPYLPNSGYIFRTSNHSFHSSPACCHRHCCLETRRVVMANWGLHNVSTSQALEDKQTAKRDIARTKLLENDLTRFKV